MGYYRIKNITADLGKRHPKANTTQIIEINANFQNTKINIEPNGEFLLEANFLPVSVQKLRTEGMVTVIELDKNTFQSFASQVANTSQITESKSVIEDDNDEQSEDKSKRNSAKYVKKEK